MIPQSPLADQIATPLRVGYLLTRHPVVKPDPHPLEHDLGQLVDREHSRYARHAEGSADQYFAAKVGSIDAWGRDQGKVADNFFNIASYMEAMKAVTQRFAPAPRVTPADTYDPFDPALAQGPPPRHTIQRALADYLHLLVRDAASGKWTLPWVKHNGVESLRMAADRAVAQHHREKLDHYSFSNAPQAVIARDDSADGPLFVFATAYLSGRPAFDNMAPACSDHAWVTRNELYQYDFALDGMRDVLLDVTTSGAVDGGFVGVPPVKKADDNRAE